MAVGCDRYTFLLSGAECELLWFSVGNALTPEVEARSSIFAEKHPLPIGRPGRESAVGAGRTDYSPQGTAVKRNYATGHAAQRSHLRRYQDPFMIGREVGVVCHSLFLGGNVNVAFFRAALGRGHDGHVNTALDFRK